MERIWNGSYQEEDYQEEDYQEEDYQEEENYQRMFREDIKEKMAVARGAKAKPKRGGIPRFAKSNESRVYGTPTEYNLFRELLRASDTIPVFRKIFEAHVSKAHGDYLNAVGEVEEAVYEMISAAMDAWTEEIIVQQEAFEEQLMSKVESRIQENNLLLMGTLTKLSEKDLRDEAGQKAVPDTTDTAVVVPGFTEYKPENAGEPNEIEGETEEIEETEDTRSYREFIPKKIRVDLGEIERLLRGTHTAKRVPDPDRAVYYFEKFNELQDDIKGISDFVALFPHFRARVGQKAKYRMWNSFNDFLNDLEMYRDKKGHWENVEVVVK